MINNDSIFEIRGLKTQFFTSKGIVPAVDGVDITVRKGEAVGLVGESGCGKSMTAMSVMQLLKKPGRVVDGTIKLNGEDLLKMNKKEINDIRGNRISMIFQEPMTALNPVYTIGKQAMEALMIHQKISKEEAKAKVIDMFAKVGIPEPEKRFSVYPHQLSGGLRQRVMIAMAMICNPELMIADEPTTALDVTIEAQILYLMNQLQKEVGTAVIMITHNLGVVAELGDFGTLLAQIFFRISPADEVFIAATFVAQFQLFFCLDVIHRDGGEGGGLCPFADVVDVFQCFGGVACLEMGLGCHEQHLGIAHDAVIGPLQYLEV